MRACSSSSEIASARISCSLRLLNVRTVNLRDEAATSGRTGRDYYAFPERGWEQHPEQVCSGMWRQSIGAHRELLGAEAAEGLFDGGADRFQDAFLNLDPGGAAPRFGLARDR